MAAASCSVSPSSTSRPLRPSSMTSGMPPDPGADDRQSGRQGLDDGLGPVVVPTRRKDGDVHVRQDARQIRLGETPVEGQPDGVRGREGADQGVDGLDHSGVAAAVDVGLDQFGLLQLPHRLQERDDPFPGGERPEEHQSQCSPHRPPASRARASPTSRQRSAAATDPIRSTANRSRLDALGGVDLGHPARHGQQGVTIVQRLHRRPVPLPVEHRRPGRSRGSSSTIARAGPRSARRRRRRGRRGCRWESNCAVTLTTRAP